MFAAHGPSGAQRWWLAIATTLSLSAAASVPAQAGERKRIELAVDICVEADGTVSKADARGEREEIQRIAIEQAVRNWRFVPARQNGKPFASRIALDVVAMMDPVFAAATVRPVGRAQKSAAPAYPFPAMRARGEAEISLVVSVEADGTASLIVPHRIQVSAGDLAVAKEFLDSAIGTVACWRFQPEIVEHASVSGRVIVPISFSLPDDLFDSPFVKRERRPLVDVSEHFDLRFDKIECPERIDPEL